MKEKLLLWDGVDSSFAKLVSNLLLRYSDIDNYLVDTTVRKRALQFLKYGIFKEKVCHVTFDCRLWRKKLCKNAVRSHFLINSDF